MTIVDSHVHVFEAHSVRYPWVASAPNLPDFTAPVESLIEAMDSTGVDHAVIIQHSCHGYDNRYILDCVERYPGRFCAVVKVDPLFETSAAELRRLVEREGAQGLRLQPAADPTSTWLKSPAMFPIWETAAELDIVIGILLQPHQLPQAQAIIEQFPQVKVIIDHMGRVDVTQPPSHPYFQTLLDLASQPNTFVKISGFYALSRQPFPYLDLRPHVLALWRVYGRERLMWATDFPLLVRAGEPYAADLHLLDHQLPDLSDEDRAWLMGKTALRLFRFS